MLNGLKVGMTVCLAGHAMYGRVDSIGDWTIQVTWANGTIGSLSADPLAHNSAYKLIPVLTPVNPVKSSEAVTAVAWNNQKCQFVPYVPPSSIEGLQERLRAAKGERDEAVQSAKSLSEYIQQIKADQEKFKDEIQRLKALLSGRDDENLACDIRDIPPDQWLDTPKDFQAGYRIGHREARNVASRLVSNRANR